MEILSVPVELLQNVDIFAMIGWCLVNIYGLGMIIPFLLGIALYCMSEIELLPLIIEGAWFSSMFFFFGVNPADILSNPLNLILAGVNVLFVAMLTFLMFFPIIKEELWNRV